MKVTAIIDEKFKEGNGAKGPWSISSVELDTGIVANVFNPVAVGDEVESYETENNGRTFTNYRKVRTGGGNSNQALKYIAEQNKELLSRVDELNAKLIYLVEKMDSRAPVKVEEPKNKVDEVFDVQEDEPIDLSEIPF